MKTFRLLLFAIFCCVMTANSYGYFTLTYGVGILGEGGEYALRSEGYVAITLWGDSKENLAPIWIGGEYPVTDRFGTYAVDQSDYARVFFAQTDFGGPLSRVDVKEPAYGGFLLFQVPELIGSSTEEYNQFASDLNALLLADPELGKSTVTQLWNDARSLWDNYEGGYMGEFYGEYVPPSSQSSLYFGYFKWEDGASNNTSNARIGGFVLDVKEPTSIPEPSGAAMLFGALAWGLAQSRRRPRTLSR